MGDTCSKNPSYEELKARLKTAESALAAIRDGRVDTILGEHETLVVRLAKAEARDAHLKQVLLAIRNVNQLIVSEDNPRRLIERACENLTETMGYHNAWIALLDSESTRWFGLKVTGPLAAAAAAGFDGGFAALHERLERGEFPDCMTQALGREDVLVVDDPAGGCLDCPMHDAYEGRAGLVRRLEAGGVTYGILSASVPLDYARDAEEQDLFNEVADDLGFALHKIEAARRLEDTRRRYREIFEHSRDGFVMVDAQGRIRDANAAYCHMLGYSLDELRALRDFYEITPERWRTWQAGEIWGNRLLTQGYSGLFENEYIHKDGTVFPVEICSYLIRRENGEIDYFWSTVRDISDRKRAEQALRENEQRLGLVIEGSGVGAWEWNVQTGETVFNEPWATMLGYTIDELTPYDYGTWERLVHPDDLDRARLALNDCIEGRRARYTCEFRMKHKSGRWIWVLDRGSIMTRDDEGRPLSMFGTHTDITQIKQAENALAQQLRFERAVAGVSKALLSPQTDESSVSVALKYLLESSGVGRVYIFKNFDDPDEGLCMKQIFEVCAPGIAPEIDNPVLQHVVYARGFERWRHALSEGNAICGHVSGFPVDERDILESQGIVSLLVLPLFVEGTFWGFVGFDETRRLRDWHDSEVTLIETAAEMLGAYFTRKRSEQRLLANEAYQRGILQTAADGFWLLDTDGRVVDVNHAYCRMTGYERGELLGMRIRDIDAEETPETISARIERVIKTGSEIFETRHRRKDRSVFPVEITTTYLDERGGQFICFCRDLTKRKADDARLFLLGHMLDLAPAGISIHDTEGNFFFANAKSLELHGYENPDEFLKVNLHDLDVPDYEALLAERFRNIAEQGEARFETKHYRKDSSTVFLEILARHIDWEGRSAILNIATDITERKRAEEKLRDEREQLLSLFNSIDEVIYITDPSTCEILYVNDFFKKQLQQDDFLGSPCYEAFQGLDAPCPFCTNDIILKQKPEPYRWEFHNKKVDRHYAIVDRIITWADGRDVRFEMAIDITDRKKAEESLRESEQRLSLAVRSAGLGIWDWNVVTNEMTWDDQMFCLYGTTERPKSYGVEIWKKNLHPDDRDAAWDACLAALRGEREYDIAFRISRPDGAIRYIKANGIVLRDDAGNPVRMLGINYDITDRKKAEEDLRKSENRVRAKLNALLDPAGDLETLNLADVVDCDQIQSLMNDFYALTDIGVGIIDLDGKVLVGTGWQDICTQFHRIHPETARNCLESDTRLASDVASGTFKVYKCKNNMWDMATPIMIGERQVGNLFLGQFFFDDEEPDLDVFREQAHRYGFDEDAYLKAYQSIPRWSRQTIHKIMTFYCNLIGVISRLSYAQIKLAQTSESLRQSEGLLNQAQEIAQVGSYLWSMVDDGLTWSREMFTIAGIDPDDFYGNLRETASNLIHPEDREGVFEQIGQMVAQKRTWPMEFRIVRPDGGVRWLQSSSRFEYDGTGKPVMCVGVHHDITEKKNSEAENEKLEAQFRQAQKMEAVGRLAGGVAHDFNNMLGIIIGHADMVLENMDPEQPFHDDLTEIRKAGVRSADLTRQLLAFARKQTVVPKVIDLNTTVEGMLKMLHRLIGEDIDMTWSPGGKLWPVKIDPGQLDQILANVCVNARDAIDNVGSVFIETANTVLDEEVCRRHAGSVPGDYVMLSVSDTGCGMDTETLSHLFEPFFTTKELGKGTGLGLATVYGVVKQNNGLVTVYSEPGQGTTFKIYLPRHTAEEDHRPEKKPEKPPGRGHETILLVEDEPAILKMTSIMLTRQGYTVLAAGTPGEAIRLATEHAGDIHLLISDVVMPEMNGRELGNAILSLYPDIKCLFMSGYTANVIAHHGVLNDGVDFIQKPFTKRQLAVTVREVLDS
ncbi:PAS domain S-box protein [Desulfatiferula olefinivorans]